MERRMTRDEILWDIARAFIEVGGLMEVKEEDLPALVFSLLRRVRKLEDQIKKANG